MINTSCIHNCGPNPLVMVVIFYAACVAAVCTVRLAEVAVEWFSARRRADSTSEGEADE